MREVSPDEAKKAVAKFDAVSKDWDEGNATLGEYLAAIDGLRATLLRFADPAAPQEGHITVGSTC